MWKAGLNDNFNGKTFDQIKSLFKNNKKNI